MSGFHGFYSLGGIVGAAAVSGMLTLGATPLLGALTAVAAMLTLLAAAYRGLLPYGSASKGPLFALPRGIVLFLGCCVLWSFWLKVPCSIGAPCFSPKYGACDRPKRDPVPARDPDRGVDEPRRRGRGGRPLSPATIAPGPRRRTPTNRSSSPGGMPRCNPARTAVIGT